MMEYTCDAWSHSSRHFAHDPPSAVFFQPQGLLIMAPLKALFFFFTYVMLATSCSQGMTDQMIHHVFTPKAPSPLGLPQTLLNQTRQSPPFSLLCAPITSSTGKPRYRHIRYKYNLFTSICNFDLPHHKPCLQES